MNKWTLKMYEGLCFEIRLLEKEKQDLVDGGLGAVRISDLPKGTDTGDPTGNIAVRIYLLAESLAAKLNRAIALRQQIEDAIDTLEDPNDRNLIRCRYIEGLSWQQMESVLGYGPAQLYRHHNRILKLLGAL